MSIWSRIVLIFITPPEYPLLPGRMNQTQWAHASGWITHLQLIVSIVPIFMAKRQVVQLLPQELPLGQESIH